VTSELEHKRIENKFVWVPYYKRIGRFGFPLSNKVDDRVPLFWTAISDSELYFVNNSNETLDYVRVKTVGFQTCDDDIVTVNRDGYSYVYESVKPSDAVKIDEYDVYLDSDFVLQTRIKIKSPTYGVLEFSTKPEKGGFSEYVLKWE
jgi:hypothetical protein